jgi:organic radical activating enzyme
LEVLEEFLSVQGEGTLVGTPAYFVRLARCNLRCPWCDTKYSWGPGREVSPSEVAERVLSSGAPLVVVTGGEPLLQQEEVALLVRELLKRGFEGTVQIETNGTVYPKSLEDLPVRVAVSPKVTCDYYFNDPETVRRILETFESELKLVLRASDLECAKKFLKELGDVRRPVVLQPLHEGEGYAEAARALVEAVLKDKELIKRVRIIPQIHKFLNVP